jgi:hypothetical protein
VYIGVDGGLLAGVYWCGRRFRILREVFGNCIVASCNYIVASCNRTDYGRY